MKLKIIGTKSISGRALSLRALTVNLIGRASLSISGCEDKFSINDSKFRVDRYTQRADDETWRPEKKFVDCLDWKTRMDDETRRVGEDFKIARHFIGS